MINFFLLLIIKLTNIFFYTNLILKWHIKKLYFIQPKPLSSNLYFLHILLILLLPLLVLVFALYCAAEVLIHCPLSVIISLIIWEVYSVRLLVILCEGLRELVTEGFRAKELISDVVSLYVLIFVVGVYWVEYVAGYCYCGGIRLLCRSELQILKETKKLSLQVTVRVHTCPM